MNMENDASHGVSINIYTNISTESPWDNFSVVDSRADDRYFSKNNIELEFERHVCVCVSMDEPGIIGLL